MFTVKEKVWLLSEDKYQNTPRIRVILLKVACWTWITFCSASVSDIDNSLCMKSEYIFFDDFKKTKQKIQENPIFLEKLCVWELQIGKKPTVSCVYVRIVTSAFAKILPMYKYLNIFRSFSLLPVLFHYRFVITTVIVHTIFYGFLLCFFSICQLN